MFTLSSRADVHYHASCLQSQFHRPGFRAQGPGEQGAGADTARPRAVVDTMGESLSTGIMTAATGYIRLGDVTYHPDTERLVAATGDEIVLRSQSARVLGHLASRLGVLFPRDDLIAAVWQNVSVTDDSLTQCILDIRRSIGDSDRTILRTVPKRGYALHGELVRPQGNGSAQVDLWSPAMPAQPDPGRGQDGEIVAQLDPRDVLPTLAVLPFRTPPGDGNAGLVSAFIGDEIAGGIARAEDMNVISRMSSVAMGQGTLADAGRMLNADFVLTGSVFDRADGCLLLLEFAETASQLVLWSDRMALGLTDWMQDNDFVDRVVAQVRRAIMMNEVRRARSVPLRDLKLYSVLHGAVGLMHRFAPADFNLAQDHLEYLTERVPGHPAPWAWLARWHVLRAVQGWSDDPQSDTRAALDFTGRALDIDPEHTLALVCEGQVLSHMAHRLDEAQHRYDAALAITPNDAQGLALRGMFAAFGDRGAEGKRDTERALHLSPFHPHRFFFLAQAAAANIATQDYPRAVTLARESLRLNRSHVSTLRTLAIAQAGAGQMDDARATAATLMRMQPDMRVSNWLRNSPSSGYELGRSAAEKLKAVGVPD